MEHTLVQGVPFNAVAQLVVQTPKTAAQLVTSASAQPIGRPTQPVLLSLLVVIALISRSVRLIMVAAMLTRLVLKWKVEPQFARVILSGLAMVPRVRILMSVIPITAAVMRTLTVPM